MKLKVKCSLSQYIEDVAKLKSEILDIQETDDADECISQLMNIKIDGMLAEEKIILGHLEDLCKAVNEHDLVEVRAAMDALGF